MKMRLDAKLFSDEVISNHSVTKPENNLLENKGISPKDEPRSGVISITSDEIRSNYGCNPQ